MAPLEAAAWIVGCACYVPYLVLSRTRGRVIRPYHFANLLGGFFFITYNVIHHTYPNLTIEVPYTITAAWALTRR